jgi:hypothetical protein
MSMIEFRTKCGFCKSDADSWVVEGTELRGYNCPICKLYFISSFADDKIQKQPFDNTLLWCISENIKYNSTELPVISAWHSTKESQLHKHASDTVVRKVEHYENMQTRHADKANELLKTIARKVGTQHPFSKVSIDMADLYALKILDEAEATSWIKTLDEAKLIYRSGSLGFPLRGTKFSLSPEGWNRVSELTNTSESKSGFIAMSFGYPERNLLEDAIIKGCESAGWTAKTIDKHEYVGGVVDEIIGKINESRFVIADLTEHKNGVYFEAGYAMGKNIPVIFTLKDDPAEREKAHFDVQHLNQIRWTSYDDLKTKLTNKLKAILPR